MNNRTGHVLCKENFLNLKTTLEEFHQEGKIKKQQK